MIKLVLIFLIITNACFAEESYWHYNMGFFDPKGHLHAFYIWFSIGTFALYTSIKLHSK